MLYVDPPLTHAEAKEVITKAYQNVFGVDEIHGGDLWAVSIAHAIGLMEGGYGANFHNNWGAITATPNPDGSCPAGTFQHGDSSFELGEYQTCFRAYETSLEGAEDFLNELYVRRPAVYDAAQAGDIRGVAQEMYATNYYLGTAPADKKDDNGDYTNVNNYISFIGKGVEDIADLYTPEHVSTNTGIGVALALSAAAVIGVVMVTR
jgi:hypothetical protein